MSRQNLLHALLQPLMPTGWFGLGDLATLASAVPRGAPTPRDSIPTLVVSELAAVGWPRRTSRLTHAKQLTPASTGDAVANCKGGASNELGVPHPPRRAERLALTTLTRLVRFNSTRQAYFQPSAPLRRRGSSARSCACARARCLGRRRVLWEVRARRRPTARVVWAIPPTSCMPHRAAATCGAGL